MGSTTQPTIALLHWGNVWEDFLDPLGVSLEEFCQEGPGGWMLGYIAALQKVHVRTVLFLFSRQADRPQRYIHAPTGTTFCILPAPKVYRAIDRHMVNPYGGTTRDTFGEMGSLRSLLAGVVRDLAPYLATPLVTLTQELRRENCSVILCQEYEYARFDLCVLLGKIIRLPVFATFQGGDFQLSRLEALLRPRTLSTCAGLIVASQTEAKRLQTHYGIPASKIARIFNPLDLTLWKADASESTQRLQTRAELGILPDALVVVNHGRMEIHRKGLDTLLEAWKQVCVDRPTQSLNLLLVGTGSDAANLAQQIADLNLTNVVWVNKYVLDRTVIRRYLLSADLYILSSRHEGFPVAPVEAMACGLPIVATDAPGVPDILSEGERSGGIMVPREDPALLAEAVGRILDNPDLRVALGQSARQRAVAAFSLESVGQQLREKLKV